ncbi:CopL family metal-binding regulatory protein [Lysobacter arvi]|uniref:CopL family metal-binding regulatory protein n=1 Tax=Lysobacter arvi TaxID=3038776 RepID=A0ABU1CBM8_9GAMM|nr:CopL family metal-binding regulatory protein [Lysobacter arvi]MDR0182177.1 CopL family metal-binding regulatory protein [Lysobacter arvi]
MRRIAFRLLLCLMLVLNGTGYAVAATQMNVAHVAAAVAALEAESKAPCHESAQAASAAHPHDADASTAGAPSCCQSSQCSCDCLQHATGAMSVLAMPAQAPPGGSIAQPGLVNRIAPPLPNLLRPPIA